MNANAFPEIEPQTEQPVAERFAAAGARPRVPLPAELASSDCKLVYLYLRVVDEATIEELRSSLGIKAISLYPVLETLESEGLVDREGERYVPTTP